MKNLFRISAAVFIVAAMTASSHAQSLEPRTLIGKAWNDLIGWVTCVLDLDELGDVQATSECANDLFGKVIFELYDARVSVGALYGCGTIEDGPSQVSEKDLQVCFDSSDDRIPTFVSDETALHGTMFSGLFGIATFVQHIILPPAIESLPYSVGFDQFYFFVKGMGQTPFSIASTLVQSGQGFSSQAAPVGVFAGSLELHDGSDRDAAWKVFSKDQFLVPQGKQKSEFIQEYVDRLQDGDLRITGDPMIDTLYLIHAINLLNP